MLSRLRTTIDRCEAALGNYTFSEYAAALYDILWRDYCDWYLEAVKPTVKTNPTQQAILVTALDAIVRLLHPVCPFVTETLHPHIQRASTKSARSPASSSARPRNCSARRRGPTSPPTCVTIAPRPPSSSCEASRSPSDRCAPRTRSASRPPSRSTPPPRC
ncbi:class I tRNA ligase family protein [Phycisphaerales bacterium ac7]